MNRRNFAKALQAGMAFGSVIPAVRAAPSIDSTTFTYKTAGGCEIHADVRGADRKIKKPVLIYIHGGALIGGSRTTVPRLVPDLLETFGYVVVLIDYRLAPETKLPQIIEDVQDAVRWVRAEGPKLFNANTSRLAIAGDSAGGYLTFVTGFRIDPRPTVVATFWGYGDITSPWYSKPDSFYLQQPRVPKEEAYAAVGKTCLTEPPERNRRGRFYLYCRQNGLWPKEVSGHDPVSESKWFDDYCPVRNVTGRYPPTIMVHGTADTDVPCEESQKMASRMAQVGVPHQLILSSGGDHGLNEISTGERAGIYQKVADFLKSRMN